jgi:hypothetical protein
MFHLLPILKGWEYKGHIAYRTNVIRGAAPIEVLRIDETGWLFQILEMTNDAYGQVMLDFQGAGLQTRSATIYPEAFRAVRSFAPDPGGYLQMYFRPNPNSTAGAYFVVALGSGFQGSLLPYVPSVVVKLYLPNESTQASAFIEGDAGVVAITDKKLFIQSLRRVLDPKASLKIDPALLAIGPAQFEKEVKE